MNNTHADMYHDLVCEHRKLSDEHSKLRLKLAQKGNLADILSYAGLFSSSLLHNTPLAGTS
jgi:hypothetical protein